MHHPINPVSWKDIAASYDPRSLPFLSFYREAGFDADDQDEVCKILVRRDEGKMS